jgi:hypothetical protein
VRNSKDLRNNAIGVSDSHHLVVESTTIGAASLMDTSKEIPGETVVDSTEILEISGETVVDSTEILLMPRTRRYLMCEGAKLSENIDSTDHKYRYHYTIISHS